MVKNASPARTPKTLDVRAQIKNPSEFPWRVSVGQVSNLPLSKGTQVGKLAPPLESRATIKSGSIDEIACVGVFEFVPGKLRGQFMDEVYRVLAKDGKAAFAVAYWNTTKGIQDYRYEWPPLSEQSFLFFNKGWREANKLELPLKCDFDFTYGYTPDAETAARNEESRSFYIKHYTNCIDALHVLLTKRP